MAILEELGRTDYEREALVLGEDVPVAAESAFWDDQKAIEVNGKVHYDPCFDHPTTRRINEEERLKRVRRAGWELLVIDYREMDTAAERIAVFLAESTATARGSGL